MKRIIFLVFLVLVSSLLNVHAQRETPAGAGDKNLASDGIKTRSIEIERMKREAAAATAASFAPINKEIEKKFPQIKEDFEGMQISEAAIIKAYTTGKTIDYSLIEISAENINKKAKRLDSNLFESKFEPKGDAKIEDKTKEKAEKPKPVKDLIIDLDNAIGDFLSSKIFGNIKIIEPEVAIKTREDLQKILHLSENLAMEAKKLK